MLSFAQGQQGYKELPSLNGILCLFSIGANKEKRKRQIRSSLVLDILRSNSHETLSQRDFNK